MSEKRVDVFIIGASKAGTTSICKLLAEHPDVTLSSPKEPHYFGRHKQRTMTVDDYHACFKGPETTIWLDGSTGYSRGTTKTFSGTAERIAAYNPKAKVVYVVRHPLERIPSLWVQHRSESRTRVYTDFNETLREKPETFVDTSDYGLQIGFYRAVLPAENILVVFFEDFKDDPDSVLASILAHVGLEFRKPDTNQRAWNGRENKSFAPAALKRLSHTPFGKRAIRRVRRSRLGEAGWKALRHAVMRRPPVAPWTPETHAWVVGRLKVPTLEFLEQLGEQGRWDVANWSLDS